MKIQIKNIYRIFYLFSSATMCETQAKIKYIT